MLNKKQDGGDFDHQTPPDPYDPFLDTLDLGEEESEAEAEAESEDDVVIVDDITVGSFGSILDSSEEVVEEKEDIAFKDDVENFARSLEGATEGDYRRKDAKDIAGRYDLKAGKKEEHLGSDDKKKDRIIVNDGIDNNGVTKDDSVVRCLERAMECGDSYKDMEDVSGSDDRSLNNEDISMKMKKGIPQKDYVGMLARFSENVTVTEGAKLAKDTGGVTMIGATNLNKNGFDVTMEEDVVTKGIIENAGHVKVSKNIVESHGVNADQADVHVSIDGNLKHIPINADGEAGNFTKHANISGQNFDVKVELDEVALDSDDLKKLEGVIKNVTDDVVLEEEGVNGVTKKSIFHGSNEAASTNEKKDKIEEWQVLDKTDGSGNTMTDTPFVLSDRNELSLTDGGIVIKSEKNSEVYLDSRNTKKEDAGATESNVAVDELEEVEGLDPECLKTSGADPSINDDNSNVSNFEESEEEYDFGSDEEDGDGCREIGHRKEIVSVADAFDMNLLRDCIEKGAETLRLVEDKDAILVVGKTGSGKSTLVQKVAGKHFKRTSVSLEGATKEVFEAQDPVPGFEIGHDQASMTKHIKCFLREGKSKNDVAYEVAYIDTPGFADTTGVEVDIATSSMMHQIAKKCRTLRFVILINYASLLEDRGGGLRSILKFVRNFVRDFNKEKKSFMFLFTHLPEPIERAKEKLTNQIVWTMNGTTDDDVKVVLSIIRKSLENNFPFVDILHPLDTNHRKLAYVIENKLKPIIKQDLSGNCILTLSSELRLGREVQSLLFELKDLLGRDQVNVDRILYIRSLFRYLEKYVAITEVERASSNCNETVDAFIANLYDDADKLIKRGTVLDQCFLPANAKTLKHTLRCIDALSNHDFSIKTTEKMIEQKVQDFQGTIIVDDGCFNDMKQKLDKLLAWCSFGEELSSIYEGKIVHIQEFTKQSVFAVDEFSTLSILDADDSALAKFVSTLEALKSIHDNSEGLSSHGINVERAFNVYHARSLSFDESLENAGRTILDMVSTLVFDEDGVLYDLKKQIDALEEVSNLLRVKHHFPKTSSMIYSMQEDISSGVTERFDTMCNEFKQQSQVSFGSGMMTQLKHLNAAASFLSDIKGCGWNKLNVSYSSLVQSVRSLLKTKVDDIEEMAQVAKDNGFRVDENFGKAFDSFKENSWFDAFLPREDRFVEQRCKAIKNMCEEQGISMEIRCNSILEALRDCVLDSKSKSTDLLAELKILLPSIVKLTQFANLIGHTGYSDLEARVRSQIVSYVRIRFMIWIDHASKWNGMVKKFDGETEKEFCALNDSLNQSLAEISVLSHSDFEDTVNVISSDAKSTIDKSFVHFCQEVERRFDSNSSYETMARTLRYVEILGNLTFTSKLLPKIKVLKQRASNKVSSDAKKIEDKMQETVDWDEIDHLISKFEKAVVLDTFVTLDVENRLAAFKDKKNGNEETVDAQLDAMIRDQDYIGIGKFLAPLNNSKEFLRRQKCKRCIGKIVTSLKATLKTLNSDIKGPIEEVNIAKIGMDLQVITLADKEIGMHLGTTYNISAQVEKFRTVIQTRLNELVKEMEEASDKYDFRVLVVKDKVATECLLDLGSFIRPRLKGMIQERIDLYKELKESIKVQCEKFLGSAFRQEDDLIKMLHNLKSECDSGCPQDLNALYYQNIGRLRNGINDLLDETEESALQHNCYDDSIEVVQQLLVCIERGLEKHLKISQTEKCRYLLVTWRQARRDQELALDFDGSSAEAKLDEWAVELKKLDPESNRWLIRTIAGLTSSNTYRRIRQILDNKVSYWALQGNEALKSRDACRLHHCLRVLDLIAVKVGTHVPLARKKRNELNTRTNMYFISLCEECQKVLRSDEYIEFELLFGVFRGFVLDVTSWSITTEAESAFESTNKSVFELMEKEIKSVEISMHTHKFQEIKMKVDNIRRFGGFVADRYALFSEELKKHNHTKSDQWVGKLLTMAYTYFRDGRDLSRLSSFALLGVVPSASKNEVKRAFKRMSLKLHPDKCQDPNRMREWNDKYIPIKSAYEELMAHLSDGKTAEARKPFDEHVRSVGKNLRELTKTFLRDGDYDKVEHQLFHLRHVDTLENLVTPPLDTQKIQSDITELVASHVKEVRVDVDTNWAERNYKDLHRNIMDLRRMGKHFKGYEDIFPESWDTGIVNLVQENIKLLGIEARSYLTTFSHAKESISDFRRCFVAMGSVLVELLIFREFTKQIMSGVLESCLSKNWGTNYIFQLGFSLKQSENVSDEELRISHTLLGEFRHFQDVKTLIWNSEIEQKAPEDTIKEIYGYEHGALLDIDQEILLKRFREFNSLYKSFLTEYLMPEADPNVLLRRIRSVADSLKPVRCSNGLVPEVQDEIPMIMAGVFCLFTLSKSGESYRNLAEASDDEQFDLEKVLMKPHNIQVVSLLCIFCYGGPSSTSLQSQLMQIRTGEGKSIILGAAAAIFGLLGIRSRCVCYSEYLSSRDYKLFEDVFKMLGVSGFVKYCTITKLSENETAAKGNIRELTLSLLRGEMSDEIIETTPRGDPNFTTEEILLVDEVDVFFGTDFYGETYNQVAELKEPEIAAIMKSIWIDSKRGKKRLRLAYLKELPEYGQLLQKFPEFEYLLENEMISMLDQVRTVDDQDYHLNPYNDQIGYKVLDTISYDVTYGYRTIFAYMKEADEGNLQNADATLARVLAMPISCGRFSYANISPSRIIGVSGTLDALGDYERNVLKSYGVTRFLNVPSVYGQSNFIFDRSGDGVSIEKGIIDFFLKINQLANEAIKRGRAVIVFFHNIQRLNEYKSSTFYRKLGRNKNTLSEDMIAADKDFVISKAATKGQVTLCTAMFGRGTDFFCKDESVEKSGGVLILQAFLSSQKSEEIQIQGRTARQGKEGSYSMILLDEDLENEFGISREMIENCPRKDRYKMLNEAREKSYDAYCETMKENLAEATNKDTLTRKYFDALLSHNLHEGRSIFEELYLGMKKRQIPTKLDVDLSFVIDNTSSMGAYSNSVLSAVSAVLEGNNSVINKLKDQYPDTELKIQFGLLGYRDINDTEQFIEPVLGGSSHFTENVHSVISAVNALVSNASGGGDIAEDHLSAIHRFTSWNNPCDWESKIKMSILLTDAPCHGFIPDSHSSLISDHFNGRHPSGLTVDSVVNDLIEKDIDLIVCSLNPSVTSKFEEELATAYVEHAKNEEENEIVSIPLIPIRYNHEKDIAFLKSCNKHIVFVLDESASMTGSWPGVVEAYNKYIQHRRQHQFEQDLISIIQFDGTARITCELNIIANAPTSLGFKSGRYTRFAPAATSACEVASRTPSSHVPVIIFMSDGVAMDSLDAARIFEALNLTWKSRFPSFGEIELHVIGFGNGTSLNQLRDIADASNRGKMHSAANIDSLLNVFIDIADGGKVSTLLEDAISQRVSDAVVDRLMAEYIR